MELIRDLTSNFTMKIWKSGYHSKTHQVLYLLTSKNLLAVKSPSIFTREATILVRYWASWRHKEDVYVKMCKTQTSSISYKLFQHTLYIDLLQKEEVIKFQQINDSDTYRNVVECYSSELLLEETICRILIHMAHSYNFLAFKSF